MAETTTETRTQEFDARGPEVQHPIVKHVARPVFDAPVIDDARKAFMKRQFCPPGCSDADFEFFVEWCSRTGLDPVLQQAYLIERTSKVWNPKTRTKEEIIKYVPMASIGGMAARAESIPGHRGMLSAAVFEGDEFDIDFENQTIHHKAKPLARKALRGAWAKVVNADKTVRLTWLTVPERMPAYASHFWGAGAPGQIQKCAEAEQYRKAYPNIYAGQYIQEEQMFDAIDVTPEDQQPKTSTGDTATDLAERLRASRPGAETAKPAAKVVDVEVVRAPKPVDPVAMAAKVEELRKTETVTELRVVPDVAELPVVADSKAEPDVVPSVRMIRALAPTARAALDLDGLKAKNSGAPFATIDTVCVPESHPIYKQWAYEQAGLGAHSALAKANADVAREHAAAPPAAKLDPSKVVIFGNGKPWKAKPIAELTGPELLEAQMLGKSKLPGLSDEKAAPVKACVAAIEARIAAMERELLPPEPGSDG